MTQLIVCRNCGHYFDDSVIDATGRCNGCRMDIQRRWKHRKEQPPVEERWNDIRARRNALVDSVRWAVDPVTSPLVPAKRDEFAVFVRQLHRVTLDFNDPSLVEWPPMPSYDSQDFEAQSS